MYLSVWYVKLNNYTSILLHKLLHDWGLYNALSQRNKINTTQPSNNFMRVCPSPIPSLLQQFFSIKIQIYEQQQTPDPEQNINTSLELVQRLAPSFWALIPQIFVVVMLWGHTSQGQFQSRVLQQATTKIW